MKRNKKATHREKIFVINTSDLYPAYGDNSYKSMIIRHPDF